MAIRRSSDLSPFDLARLTTTTETHVHLAYLGTTNPNLRKAVFKLVWIDPVDNKTLLQNTRLARRHQPVTGDITTEDIPDLLAATHLVLTITGRLTALSYHIPHHLSHQLSVH